MVLVLRRRRSARTAGLLLAFVLTLAFAGCIGPTNETTGPEEPGRFSESDPDVIYQVHVDTRCDPSRTLALPADNVPASHYGTLEIHYALETAAGRLELAVLDANGVRIFERSADVDQPLEGDETVKASANQGDWTVRVTCGADADRDVQVGITVRALD